MRFSFACKTSHKAIPCLLAALALLSACATTPRELGSEPIQLRIDSRTVADLSALEPRLVHYSDKRTLLRLAPTEAWRVPRMRTPELQEMVAHCDANGRQVLQLQRAVLRDGAGEVLATFVADGRQPLTSLEQYASYVVSTAGHPKGASLELTVEPDAFHGRLREEVQLVFRDGEAEIAPGVHASVESMTTTPQEIALGRRVAQANFIYVKLQNRSDHAYVLNGHDTGAMEAGASHMLTAIGLHGTTLPPGGSAVIRLPIELLGVDVEPGYERSIRLQDYLAGWDGSYGPVVMALVPLRVQIELQGSAPDATMQRGVITPVMQVQKLYRLERAGCF